MASKQTPFFLANFINGEYRAPQSGSYIDNVNPATAEVLNKIPNSDERDVNEAVAAASDAFDGWRKTPLKARVEMFKRITELLVQNRETLTQAECHDMGKSRFFCDIMDRPMWEKSFNEMGKLAEVTSTNYFQMEDAVSVEHRDPLGVCGLIVAWNFPLFLSIIKISNCIILGNTCVLKPSEISPSTAHLLCGVLKDAGLPRGVVNVVHGYGPKAGEPLVCHPKVRAISFTGGTETGRRVASLAAASIKKLHMELGGKNPAIVFGDCYFEETVPTLAAAAFGNSGQVCICQSRHFVHESIYDKYVDALVNVAKTAWIPGTGEPLKQGTLNGPLSSHAHRDKVEGYLKLAIEEGGTILCGGKRPTFPGDSKLNKGAFLEPTVIVGLDAKTSRCAREEMFGPVVTVHKFSDESEVLAIANSSEYGLCASVWTADARRGQRVARELQTGIVWINCFAHSDWRQPHGGVKQSGISRESSTVGLDFFSEIKPIVSKL